jgi:hypothetical protein
MRPGCWRTGTAVQSASDEGERLWAEDEVATRLDRSAGVRAIPRRQRSLALSRLEAKPTSRSANVDETLASDRYLRLVPTLG